MKIKGLIIFVISFLVSALHGQGFTFLDQQYVPRANALANATVADRSSYDNILINPASLTGVTHHHCTAFFTDHLVDFKSGMIGGQFYGRRYGTFAVNALYFDYGTFEQIDRYAMYTGHHFNVRDLALVATYSVPITGFLAVGASAKYGYSVIDQYDAEIVASDFGIVINTNLAGGLNVGASILNLGKNVNSYRKTRELLPVKINIGVAKSVHAIPLIFFLAAQKSLIEGINVSHPQDGVLAGLEVWPQKNIVARIGYNHTINKGLTTSSRWAPMGFSFGFGFAIRNYRIDLSYTDYGDLGAVNQVGVGYRLPGPSLADKSADLASKFSSPLAKLSVELYRDKLILLWSNEQGGMYNVYGRYLEDGRWAKLNTEPILNTFIVFEKPKANGYYQFYVTLVKGSEEHDFSEVVTVNAK